MSDPKGYAVVIGSSAGGIEMLKRLMAKLPADFPVPVFVVQHLAPDFPSVLPQILSAAGKLRAVHPRDGDVIKAPRIYVAPPDHHLLIEDSHVAVKRGPKENRFRPSADALFRSAAYTYGAGAIGVVLSGSLSDGTSGLWTIKRLGGTTIVQHPDDAPYPSMPLSALKDVDIDYSLPVAEIAEVLMTTIKKPLKDSATASDDDLKRLKIEHAIAGGKLPLDEGVLELGQPSRYSCPECHGVLGRIQEGAIMRYRCHTGHAYTQDALLSSIHEASDETLAQTITALEETVMLLEEIALRFGREQNTVAAERCSRRAQLTKDLLLGLRNLVLQGSGALT